MCRKIKIVIVFLIIAFLGSCQKPEIQPVTIPAGEQLLELTTLEPNEFNAVSRQHKLDKIA